MNCRLCSHDKIDFRYQVKGFRIGVCAECGLLQMLDEDTSVTSQLIYGADYFKRGKYRSDTAEIAEQRRRLSMLESATKFQGGRVLDLGCATGSFITLAKEKFEVWGLEISHDAVNSAKARNSEIAEKILCGSIEDTPLPEKSFDAVTCWDVIEHVEHPVAVIDKIKRILKPGGALLLSTPNSGALSARVFGRRWAFMTPPEHICLFNRATMYKLLSSCDFSVERWGSYGKWVNMGFLLYKIRKSNILPIPQKWIALLQEAKIGTFPLYIPTGDIQYVTARAIDQMP